MSVGKKERVKEETLGFENWSGNSIGGRNPECVISRISQILLERRVRCLSGTAQKHSIISAFKIRAERI